MMRTVVLALALSSGLSIAAEPAAPTPPPPIPLERVKAGNDNLTRHMGTYEPLQIRWTLNENVADVLAVFPHPQIASDVYLATDAGLLKSTDGGLTFNKLPECTSDKIGHVNAIAFRPDAPQRFILATQGHGLFATSDGGATVKQLASKATGLASDNVINVHYAADDDLLHTIVAVHGADAPGLSRSVNSGKTWEVLFPQQHVHQVFWPRRGDKQVLLDGSPPDDIERHTLYFLASITEPWQKLVSDVLITGAAAPRTRGDTIYLATADQGFYRVAREGGIVTNFQPADESEWASVGVTFGATADSEIIYAYHPKKLGLVLMTPAQLAAAQKPANDAENAATDAIPEGDAPAPPGPRFRTQSDGLFTGPLVLEGAHIRAGANGNVFYAAVNRMLYRSTLLAPGVVVLNVNVSPSSLFVEPAKIKSAAEAMQQDLDRFASSHDVYQSAAELNPKMIEHRTTLDIRRFTVTATVKTAATDPATSVTVDLSRLAKSSTSPLFDDGQHGDGAAGDGVYANAFDLDFAGIRRYSEDWRYPYPGPMALTVSAITQSKALAGAVGTLSLYPRRDSISLVSEYKPGKISGNVVGDIARVGKTRENVKVIGIKSAGDWAIAMSNYRSPVSINNEQVLSFYIRSSKPTSDPVFLQLRDGPTYQRPNVSQRIDLMAEGFIANKQITPTEQRVMIPVPKLLENAGDFQPGITVGVIISGSATQPVDLLVRDIKLVPAPELSIESETEAP